MPIIFHLTSVIFPETSNSRRGLTQNWDYLSDGRQFITQSLGWYRPLFLSADLFFWTKLYFSFLGGDFFSWSSRWIVRWATPLLLDHRTHPNIGRQFLCMPLFDLYDLTCILSIKKMNSIRYVYSNSHFSKLVEISL